MARTKRSLKLTPTERKRLLRVLRQQGEGGMALRAAIILWSAQGQSAASIAQALGVTPRTVYGWRQRWRALGLEGLADAPRSGRPARVDAEYLELLVRTAETDPHQLGFAFARWTCARLAAYLQERTGLQVSA
jgi:transposase